MKIAAFLYHFNDIDHIVPVLWKLLTQKHAVTVVMLDPDCKTEKDPRLQHLKQYDNFELTSIHRALLPHARWLFSCRRKGFVGWIVRNIRLALFVSGISTRWAVRFLKQRSPEVCIFEWGGRASRGRQEFFKACEILGIRKVCLPHGLNIYLNPDMTAEMREVLRQGKKIRIGNRHYDAYVYQSNFHRQQDIALGMDPGVSHTLGSARYYPEWQKLQEGFYEAFLPQKNVGARIKTVFMLPHWEYNVDKAATLALIAALAEHEGIYLVVKDHPREAEGLPEELCERLSARENFESVTAVSSVALIKWADVVVNFGSSIGIEALLQNKTLISPSYLHANTTIFDTTKAAVITRSLKETINIFNIMKKQLARFVITQDSKRALYREIIYGGRDEHDVLESYSDFVTGKKG